MTGMMMRVRCIYNFKLSAFDYNFGSSDIGSARYNDVCWTKLLPIVKKAAETLGYTRASWNGNAKCAIEVKMKCLVKSKLLLEFLDIRKNLGMIKYNIHA